MSSPINADQAVANIQEQQRQLMLDSQKINMANQQLQMTIQNNKAESDARSAAANAMKELISNL